MTGALHHLIVLFLIVIFPIWDRVETRRLRSDPTERARIRSYRITIGWLWIVTILLLLTTPITTLIYPIVDPRLAQVPLRAVALGMVAAILAGALLPVLLVRRSEKARTQQLTQLERISFFLPRSRAERWWFALVSLSAGICEELIFRGFLIQYFTQLPISIAPFVAYLLSALVFGIDHAYQGVAGIVSTAFLALVFTVLFVATGGIWLPMLVHALIDLRILLIVPPAPPLARA